MTEKQMETEIKMLRSRVSYLENEFANLQAALPAARPTLWQTLFGRPRRRWGRCFSAYEAALMLEATSRRKVTA